MLLAQAADDANTVSVSGAGAGVAIVISLVFLALVVAYYVFYLMAVAKLATSAGYSALNGILVAFVPIWNLMWLYKLYVRSGQSGWLLFLQAIPIYAIFALRSLASRLQAMPTTAFAQA